MTEKEFIMVYELKGLFRLLDYCGGGWFIKKCYLYCFKTIMNIYLEGAYYLR